MSKYKPLADYLAGLHENHVQLTFAEIERITKLTLPQTAYDYPAWWANSRTRDTHGWAHLWLQAGWESCNLNLAGRVVEFRRAGTGSRAATIASLYPTKLEHLMDLLVQAEVDVDAWSYRGDGTRVDHPKANPDYCYDWSFGTEADGFALCIWCDLMDDSTGPILYTENVQEHARLLEQTARNLKGDAEKRSRVLQQARRARAFDDAIDISYRKGKSLRVLLNAGNLRSREEIAEKSSKVARRALDPLNWYVHRYDRNSGECLLVRAVPPDADPGQGEDQDDSSPGADDARRFKEIKARRGQREFREALLAAYSRRCAVTGCRVADLLEAAHIVPHAEEVNYRVTNGLLLRADIHTLYDLQLLSIDERCKIRVAKALRGSEYWKFNDVPLVVLPDSFRDQPGPTNLASRHARFLAAESQRP